MCTHTHTVVLVSVAGHTCVHTHTVVLVSVAGHTCVHTHTHTVVLVSVAGHTCALTLYNFFNSPLFYLLFHTLVFLFETYDPCLFHPLLVTITIITFY